MASRDPFYSVKDKVTGLVNKLRSDFSTFATLSTRSSDFQSLSAQLKQQLSAVEVDLNDLAQTIIIVEQNRPRFPSITEAELNIRKQFVNETKSALQTWNDQLKRAINKSTAEQRRALMDQPSTSNRFSGAMNNASTRAGDDFVSSSAQQQAQLYKQQDVVLEDMDAALARLSNISQDITSELVEQDHMLTEVDESMDEAKGSMNNVIKKMDKLLGQSDKGRYCCIATLVVVVIILLAVLVT